MKTKIKNVLLLFMVLYIASFTSCKDDGPDVDPNVGKPKVENLALTPANNLKYGDNVKVSANFSDDRGLRMYTLQMSNASGIIYEKTNMLTGKTFALNMDIPIPLPKNAAPGNMTVSITLKNSGNQNTTEEVVISNLALPTFENLYMVINNTAYTLKKNGAVYEIEDFIPAGAVGKIYSNANKTGLFWGTSGTEIIALGNDDIAINASDKEEFVKVSFNPFSFALTVGNPQVWTPITDAYYIFGGISGHWADGEISTEKTKMKMQGFANGTRKMWSWTAPNTGTGDPVDDMWGAIVPGLFRFKKAGAETYVTFDGVNIVNGADNKDKSFVVSAGGPFTIKLFSNDGTTISSVRLDDGTKTLEYSNDGIFVNGSKAATSMSFAGKPLDIVPGNFYVYQGTMEFTKDQSITSPNVDLTTAFCDPDVFTGKGNATWTFTRPTASYYVRVDIFSGEIYVRDETGYPNAIYMDGWSWGKMEGQNIAWMPNSRLTLYREGATNFYSSTLYINPWGGDISFFAAPPTVADYSNREIFAKYFDGVTLAGTNMLFPSIAEAGYFKVRVDLKDGFTFNLEQKDGTTNNYLLVPTNGKKFTIAFTAL